MITWNNTDTKRIWWNILRNQIKFGGIFQSLTAICQVILYKMF